MLRSLLGFVRALLAQMIALVLRRVTVMYCHVWLKEEVSTIENWNQNMKDLLGIVLAAAAATLCIVIDMVLKEDDAQCHHYPLQLLDRLILSP